jgi:hypothetical protein
MNTQSPTANSADQRREEPLGDRGNGDRSWTPEEGEQGISNRVGDEAPDAEREPASSERNLLAAPEEDDVADDDDFDEDDEEDDEDEDDADADEVDTAPA